MQPITFETIYLKGQLQPPSFVSSLSSHQKKVCFVVASIFLIICAVIWICQTLANGRVSRGLECDKFLGLGKNSSNPSNKTLTTSCSVSTGEPKQKPKRTKVEDVSSLEPNLSLSTERPSTQPQTKNTADQEPMQILSREEEVEEVIEVDSSATFTHSSQVHSVMALPDQSFLSDTALVKKALVFGDIPSAVVVNCILPYLSLHELGLSSRVNTGWNKLLDNPTLWRSVIYRDLAFNSKNWADVDPDIVKGVEAKQEIESLPKNIAEELKASAFPGKNIRKTHVLVRLPKGLTINKLGEILTKTYFPGNPNGYKFIRQNIIDELGHKSAESAVWLLMTTDVIEETREKSYSEQKKILSELGVSCDDPTTLEAITCILAEFFRSKGTKRLFNDKPWTYMRCQDKFGDYQVVVGAFSPDGLRVHARNINAFTGVAVFRKFKAIGS